jgi:hypothetical protein
VDDAVVGEKVADDDDVDKIDVVGIIEASTGMIASGTG